MSRIIRSDPKNICVFSAKRISPDISEFLTLELIDDKNNKKTVDVYTNKDKLYKIKFFDTGCQKYITVICKVLDVSDYFITIIFFKGLDAEGLCPCGHKDILLKYVDMVKTTIQYTNISDIEEFIFKEPKPDVPEFKEVIKVSILGISAEFIRSVIVRLRVYEDGSCCDVTETIPVDMKVGNRYNVTYISHKDHAMYEINGVLKSINIDQNFGDDPNNHGFVRHECECDHHDEIGMNNVIYDSSDRYDMDHFLSLPKDCPDKVSFVFDTSKANHSTFDTVILSDIRGIRLVEDSGDPEIESPQIPPECFPQVPPLKYPCCGSCCENADFGKCNGMGTCCNDHPTNIPNPCPPHPPCHPPHHPNDSCHPPLIGCCESMIIDNKKVWIGDPNNKGHYITIEDMSTGEITNISMEELVRAYLNK